MSDKVLTVFYDGNCPLCRAEINHYRKRVNVANVKWVNLDDPEFSFPEHNLSRNILKNRFHVMTKEKKMYSGGPAFVQLWLIIPEYRRLAKFLNRPAFLFVLDKVYDGFLFVRPIIQKIASICLRDKNNQCS